MLALSLLTLVVVGVVLILIPPKRTSRWWFQVRLLLEGLEARVVPSTFEWVGGKDTGPWTSPSDWKKTVDSGNGSSYPGDNKNTDDVAVFDNALNGNSSPNLLTSVTIASLDMGPTFDGTLTIQAFSTLTISGAGGRNSWLDGGTLAFLKGTSLSVTGQKTLLSWLGTDIDSGNATGGQTPGGTIYISGGATLNCAEDAQKLGANLVVGQDPKGNASAGTVNFATYDFKNNTPKSTLAFNITLYNNANITNYAQGVINFNQGSKSATAGGIALDPNGSSPNSTFSNYGTVNRQAPDTQDVQIGVPVTGLGASSLLFVDAKCGINFLKKYKMQAGSFKKGGDTSRVAGFDGAGGAMIIQDPGAAGTYVTYVEDDLDIEGATVEFDITTPGALVTLSVAGNVEMSAGSITVPSGQAMNVGGDVDQSGGTLETDYGTVAVAGAYSETGGVLSANYGTVSVTGIVTLSSGSIQLDGATLNAAQVAVQSGGVLSGWGAIGCNLTSAGEVDVPDGATLAISGDYSQTAGVTNVGTSQNADMQASGAFTVTGGTLTLSNSTLQAGNGLAIETGAVFSGYGTIDANLTNSGSLTVGGAMTATLSVNGNYSQTSGGALTLDLQYGSYYTMLNVSGQASLDGAFTLNSLDGQSAQVGNYLDLIGYSSESGTFTSTYLPSLSSGTWEILYTAYGFELFVQPPS